VIDGVFAEHYGSALPAVVVEFEEVSAAIVGALDAWSAPRLCKDFDAGHEVPATDS
jgi:hypothetical protein